MLILVQKVDLINLSGFLQNIIRLFLCDFYTYFYNN